MLVKAIYINSYTFSLHKETLDDSISTLQTGYQLPTVRGQRKWGSPNYWIEHLELKKRPWTTLRHVNPDDKWAINSSQLVIILERFSWSSSWEFIILFLLNLLTRASKFVHCISPWTKFTLALCDHFYS